MTFIQFVEGRKEGEREGEKERKRFYRYQIFHQALSNLVSTHQSIKEQLRFLKYEYLLITIYVPIIMIELSRASLFDFKGIYIY